MTSVLVVVRRAGRAAHGRAGDPRLRAGAGARRRLHGDALRARAEHASPIPGSRCWRRAWPTCEALVAAARRHDVVIAQELPPVALERLARRPGPARRRPLQPGRRRGARGRRRAAAAHAPPHPRPDRRRATLALLRGGRPRDLRERAPARPLDRRDGAARADRRRRLRARSHAAVARRRRPVRPARRSPRRRRRARCARRSRRSAPAIACSSGAAACGAGSTRSRRCGRSSGWRGRRAGAPRAARARAPGAGGERAGGGGRGGRRGRAARRAARAARPRQRRLGPVRGTWRVAGGGRPRRHRPPRPPRGALRPPHPRPRLPVGGPAGRRLARGRAGGAGRARRARGGRRAGRRRRASRTPARGCSGRTGAAARERIAAAAPGLRWSAVAAPLVAWCETAAERPRRPVRRGIVRRAALGQYRWALAETLGDEGAAAALRRVGRRLRRGARLR